MKKFGDTVTNKHTGKSFFVSTVPVNPLGDWFWQTAVFKQRFGPLAGLFRPALFFGAASEPFAQTQHESVIALVRDVLPKRWEAARDRLAIALIEGQSADDAADNEDFHQSLLRIMDGPPK